MESIVGFIGKMLLSVLITMFLLTVAGVFIQYGEKNDFQQYVNASIERHGGLIEAAVNDIQNYSNENFNGRFTILTRTEKKSFGEEVDYQYEMKITPLFMQFDVITLTDSGTASSKVR